MRATGASFKPEMVCGILSGNKTITRRPLKDFSHVADGVAYRSGEDGDVIRCPYGQPGDRIWVREAWRTTKKHDHNNAAYFELKSREAGYNKPWVAIQYEADGKRRDWDAGIWGNTVGRYRHARFMPRWASRILLEIVSVRLEKLTDITDADAKAEGMFERHAVGDGPSHCTWTWHTKPGFRFESPREAFKALWEELYGCDSWKPEVWVWVVEFKKVRL